MDRIWVLSEKRCSGVAMRFPFTNDPTSQAWRCKPYGPYHGRAPPNAMELPPRSKPNPRCAVRYVKGSFPPRGQLPVMHAGSVQRPARVTLNNKLQISIRAIDFQFNCHYCKKFSVIIYPRMQDLRQAMSVFRYLLVIRVFVVSKSPSCKDGVDNV